MLQDDKGCARIWVKNLAEKEVAYNHGYIFFPFSNQLTYNLCLSVDIVTEHCLSGQ